ncbi:MAG: cystathionine beta-lyase [Rickettsiales bacterium]
MIKGSKVKKETLLAHIGTSPDIHRGSVNIPPYRASTVLFPNLAAFEAAEQGKSAMPTYARFGTPSTEALENVIAELEGADHSIVTASGLAAIVSSIMAFVSSGDHLLMVDNAYAPNRRFCDQELKRFGVEVTYYDPTVGAGIAGLIKENTKVIFVESPGSLTFEMQDIPAIAKIAREKDIVVIADNTWATPMYINPFEMGVDISIHSATKYISGHSDLVMGVISCKEKHYPQLLRSFRNFGASPSGDNCYLALRGLRTMAVRLKQHYENGLKVARWLQEHDKVEKVFYPPLPESAGHEIWKRDFDGATSLFSIVLKENYSSDRLAKMIDGLENFGMGYSWGGFESLIIPFKPKAIRTATNWQYEGTALRLHIGLEDVDDLIEDLERGFERLK